MFFTIIKQTEGILLVLTASKNTDKVKEKAKKAVQSAQDFFVLAEEQRKNKQYKDSIENYLQDIILNRKNLKSYIGLADSYKNLKNYEKAIYALRKADKLIPNNREIQKELAICNIANENYCTGIKHLINSIKLNPDNPDVQMQLAMVHEIINEEDMALKIYQKIIETNPTYIRAYIQQATLYMNTDDYYNSALSFKEVIKLNPDYYRAYLALGICYDKLNNPSAAKRYYKKYLKLSKGKSISNYNNVTKRITNLSVQSNMNVKLRIV